MRNKSKTIVKCTSAYIILIIAIIFAILPVLWVLSTSLDAINSLSSTSLGLLPRKFTLNNYKEMLFGANSHFFTWFFNSVFVAVTTTILCLFLGITAAYACSRFRFKGRKTFLNMFLLLNAFPNILSIVAYYKILSSLNLVNTLSGLIIIYAGGQLVFTVWNLKGYFDTVPYEIEEASLIDGATPFDIFSKIVLPLSKPALAVTSLFIFMAAWNEYIFAMTFTSNKSIYTLSVALWSLQNAGDYSTNWPLFAAGSIIIAIPVIIVFLFLQKSLVSGLTIGSSK
ncbi:MAG: transporter permease subunit [Clostridiaceae bacterium]|jgi:arabinogalactan oligomer/maltooligosaccharide transport system permease protein|nr:transporter permease subunit [Clostridiaceae bacterium]